MIRRIEVLVNGSPISFDNLRVSMSHNAEVGSAIFSVRSSSINIGNWIDIDVNIDGNTGRLFGGYVKQKTYRVPDRIYELVAYDMLVRAKDYFIASSTPDSAYKARNISAEDLVRDILNMCGITGFDYEPSNFTFAIHTDIEVNLENALDFIRKIANIIAFTVWATPDGVVHFKNRRPYVMSGDTPSISFIVGDNILRYTYTKSDRDLRNRVVIYGNSVYAEAKASSPYLPAGYYKTVVLASPLINSQSFADKAAQYNLQMLNRLTEELSMTVEGNPNITPWKIASVSGISTEVDGDWYVYSVTHNIDDSGGYTCEVILRR